MSVSGVFGMPIRPSVLFALALLIFPWINPIATGPSAAVLPWLVACGCSGVLILMRPKHMDRLATVSWLTAALLSAALGLIQYMGVAAHFTGFINISNAGEAFANLRQRNQFASLTNIGLLALVCLVQRRVTLSAQVAMTAVAAAALLGVGNAASSSRTGLLQLLILAGTCFFWSQMHASIVRRLILATGVGYAVATLMLPGFLGAELGNSSILGRFSQPGPACQSRWVLWDNVLTLISHKPWLGWGWGELDYAHFMTLYPGDATARFCDILDNAHNLPLHLAVELGIPLAALFCVVVAGLIGWLRPWHDQNPARQMAWGVLLVIGLHSLLEYPLWYGPFQIAVLLCILILWQTHPQQSLGSASVGKSTSGIAPLRFFEKFKKSAIKIRPYFNMAIALSATIIVAICSYAMWDYHRISQIYLVPSERSAAYRYNTLEKIRGSWLFQNQVQFAELTTTVVSPENANYVHAQAQRLLHFSPEARVVEKRIDSALLLGLTDEAAFFKRRFLVAFPEAFAQWQARNASP
jgi:lipoprotein signal peptidase